MTTYENFNSSAKSFRIFCDKLTSTHINKNLIIESSTNNIEFKVLPTKKIIFNNTIVFNRDVDLNNKPLAGLESIKANTVSINTTVLNSNINIINKSSFYDNPSSNNTFETITTNTQDLSNALFSTIDICNNSSVLVSINIMLACSYAINERITLELWRDLSMLIQSKELGSVNAAGRGSTFQNVNAPGGGGIPIPYSLTYLDTSLNGGTKKYYLKYKLENNNNLTYQGIINISTSESGSSNNIILKEVPRASVYNYYNKTIFDTSKCVTTSYEIQDLSNVLYNIIYVANTNVQIAINLNLYCCYDYNERITIEVWRDNTMISQSRELGTVNATAGLTIPYSFNYIDTNLSDGPKKYYLKYKLEKDPASNASTSIEESGQGIVNISTLDSIRSSNILLTNIPKNNSNLSITSANSFLTNTSDLQDLSGSLYNNFEVSVPSSVLVDLNFTLYGCYANNERITIQLWRNLFMVSQNSNIGNANATGGSRFNFRLSLLDESVSAGSTKYYIKYKLESNLSAQAQGIIDVYGTYSIIEDYNRGILLSYKILSYANMDYYNGYIINTCIGYNPNINGDKGSQAGRRDAYFTYIDVNGGDASFNSSLYVKKNIIIDGSASITSDLSVNAIPLANVLSKLSLVNNLANTITLEFSNNKITTLDLSAANITISNELYVLNKYYANNLNISGQLLSNVLRVPNEFRIKSAASYNNNENFVRIIDTSWVPMGRPIVGQVPEDINERFVALNADGNIVAIGSPYSDGTISSNTNIGDVRVYQYNSDDAIWVPMGQTITGDAPGDQCGYSISLNADGNRLAIGSQYKNYIGYDDYYIQGRVRVYEYRIIDASWIQIGQSIDGEEPNNRRKWAISLNNEGNILAIGAYNYNDFRGRVKVYEYRITTSDTSWVPMGQTITGDALGDRCGYSISLNSDGYRLAISAPYNNNYSGQVRVYEYRISNNDTSWVPIGQAIVGEASFDETGHSISLNAFGNRLAIGSPFISIPNGSYNQQGNVRIYEYINDTSWVPIGQTISGKERGDQLGYSISLNAIGNTIAIGGVGNYSGEFVTITRGYVRVYQYVNDTSWVLIGSTIYGQEIRNYSEWSVSLNANGTNLAISFPYNNNTERVRVYQDIASLLVSDSSFIVNGDLTVRGNKTIIKSSLIGFSAYSINIANNLRNKDDLSFNPAGIVISNVAALHYDGTRWNISGGNLLIANMSTGFDVSLINLQTTISNSLIASKFKYDSSFTLLQANIDNSFSKAVYYSKSDVDNSYVTIRYSNTNVNDLKYNIDLSFVTKQTFSISGENSIKDYVTKAYVDGSFAALNSRLDLSFVLKKNVELSYNDLSGQIIGSFAYLALANVDVSSIIIENIKTPRLTLGSHVSISGDLIVGRDTCSNSLTISNSYSFSNNGYSSIYSPVSNTSTIIEEYYSKFNNYERSVFYISADGSLYNLNNGRGGLSDSRLKEKIADASPKLEDLLKVRIVDYNLKDNSSKKYIGVLAQELEELFPNLVETESPNTQEIEYGKTTKYKTVKYSCFNVMLIKALQEQQEIINNLNLRLERLKEVIS